MIEHLQILVFILLVLSYFWLAFYIRQTYKIYHYKYLQELLKIVLVFLAFITMRFVRLYLVKNILNDFSINLVILIDIFRYFLSLWVIYLLINILLSFRERSFTKKQKTWIFLIVTFGFALYIYGTYYQYNNSIFKWVEHVLNSITGINFYITKSDFMTNKHVKPHNRNQEVLGISIGLIEQNPENDPSISHLSSIKD